MTTERKYVPQIGVRVRMPLMSDYRELGLEAWTVLTCVGVDNETVVCQRSLTANGAHDGELVNVPLARVESPIGWRQRYTIHVQPEKVTEVLSWLARGISVRFSQYIGDGSTVFQPLDNSGTPHWKYTEVTDTLTAEETRDAIEIVKLETVYDAFVPCACRYCEGTGKHTSNAALVEQDRDTAKCETCGLHLGFSFTEPWHARGTWGFNAPNGHQYGTPMCSEACAPGEDWNCKGTGQGARYLSEMDRAEKKRAVSSLERDGWKVWYQKRGQMWFMERETVVKRHGQDVSEVTA